MYLSLFRVTHFLTFHSVCFLIDAALYFRFLHFLLFPHKVLRILPLNTTLCLGLKIFPYFSSFGLCVHIVPWCSTSCLNILGVCGCFWGPQTRHHTNSLDFQILVIAEQAVSCCSGVAHRASPIFILNTFFYCKFWKWVVSKLLCPVLCRLFNFLLWIVLLLSLV